MRERMLGWTQQEISERLKVDQSVISRDIMQKFNSEDLHIFDSGHLPEEIGLRLGMPVQVVLAIQFKKMSDQERMKELKINIQPYDVWNFNRCHDLMGDK